MQPTIVAEKMYWRKLLPFKMYSSFVYSSNYCLNTLHPQPFYGDVIVTGGKRSGCVSNLLLAFTSSSTMIYQLVEKIYKAVSPKHTHPAMKASPPKGVMAPNQRLMVNAIRA